MGCGASSTPQAEPADKQPAKTGASPTQRPPPGTKPAPGSPNAGNGNANKRSPPPPGGAARPAVPDPADDDQPCELPSPDEHPYPADYKPLVPTAILGTFSTHGLMPKPVGMLPIKVNQDYGICVYPFLGRKDQMLLVVCDGHGENGTDASSLCTHTIVESLESSECMKDCAANEDAVPAALVAAFDKAHETVCDEIDAVKSGTTVVLTLVAGKKIWSAHAGDSRSMIVKANSVLQLSEDHKPSCASERDRLVAAGGIVDLVMDGGRLCVIDMEAQKMLGLAVSRSVGDSIFHQYGCIHKPEIRLYDAQKDDCWLILASDGVWEFIDCNQAAALVRQERSTDATQVCRSLITRAKQLWKDEEGDYRDDITAMVVHLPNLYAEMEARIAQDGSLVDRSVVAAREESRTPLMRRSEMSISGGVEETGEERSEQKKAFLNRRASTTTSEIDDNVILGADTGSSGARPPPGSRKGSGVTLARKGSAISPELDMNLW